MYNRGLRIFLTFVLCTIFLSYFTASANGKKSVYDILSTKGFDQKTRPLFCWIRNGNIVKNINLDTPILLDELKKVVVIKGVPGPSDYTINFASGSSFASQLINISVAKTGNGYVQYMGKNIAFFKSVDLYEFCVTAFNKSKILIHFH